MKIALGTIEVDNEVREAIRAYYGKGGRATRAEVKAAVLGLGEAGFDIAVDEGRKFMIARKGEPARHRRRRSVSK